MKEICGHYRHYKEQKPYRAFCEAIDETGVRYVLYQKQYGDQSFWIRPYDMFFESVRIDENGTKKEVLRFTPTETPHGPTEELRELEQRMQKEAIIALHSETLAQYVVTAISRESGSVEVKLYSPK